VFRFSDTQQHYGATVLYMDTQSSAGLQLWPDFDKLLLVTKILTQFPRHK